MKKDKYGHDIQIGLDQAKYILSLDWRVVSDLALAGEFLGNYGMTPKEYIKKYGDEKWIKNNWNEILLIMC